MSACERFDDHQLSTYWDFLKTNPPFPQAGSGFSLHETNYLTIAIDGEVCMWMRESGGSWQLIPPLRGNL